MLFTLARDLCTVVGVLTVCDYAGRLIGHLIGAVIARAILRRHGAPR